MDSATRFARNGVIKRSAHVIQFSAGDHPTRAGSRDNQPVNFGNAGRGNNTRAGDVANTRHRINANKKSSADIVGVRGRFNAVASFVQEVNVDGNVIEAAGGEAVGDFHHRIEALPLHRQLLHDFNLHLRTDGFDGMRIKRQHEQRSD